MGETFVRGHILARRTPGGNITIDTTHTNGGLIRHLGARPHIEIENNDLDDAIAVLKELRGDWSPTVGDTVGAMNVARAGQKGIVARNQGGRLPWIVLWPDGCETGYAAHEIWPWRPRLRAPDADEKPRLEKLAGDRVDWVCQDCGAFGFGIHRAIECRGRLPPRTAVDAFGELGRKMEAVAVEFAQQPNHTFRAITGGAARPIERYVRAAVAIPGSKGRIDGTIEIGLHYEWGVRPSAIRSKLIEVGEAATRLLSGRSLDEDIADVMTLDLDRRIVGLWGDRPRFIEVWRGAGDDAEPLTQVYAPHGMPIGDGR